jgi:hypothetical protein
MTIVTTTATSAPMSYKNKQASDELLFKVFFYLHVHHRRDHEMVVVRVVLNVMASR